jgi:hypothetical protein
MLGKSIRRMFVQRSQSERRVGTMVTWCCWPLANAFTIGFQVVLSVFGTVHAETGDRPAISGPAVREPVEPKVSGGSVRDLPPAERYRPGGPVRVMPDLRLSDQPDVRPPVSPGVQERDLREAPPLPPLDTSKPPRVMPDLKESSPNAPEGESGGPPTERQR